jgi:hypothetical protein
LGQRRLRLRRDSGFIGEQVSHIGTVSPTVLIDLLLESTRT